LAGFFLCTQGESMYYGGQTRESEMSIDDAEQKLADGVERLSRRASESMLKTKRDMDAVCATANYCGPLVVWYHSDGATSEGAPKYGAAK
jgi:hypothetical protein